MEDLNTIYPRLKNLNVNLNNLDNWALSVECFNWIVNNISLGSNIVEFGSGSGTVELSNLYNTYAIEHQEVYTKLAPKANYILADIINDWYNPEIVFDSLPKEYSLIIVDGPPNINQTKTRNNIEKYWGRLNTRVPIIMDDTHRQDEYNFALKSAEILGKRWELINGWQKSFIVLI